MDERSALKQYASPLKGLKIKKEEIDCDQEYPGKI